MEENKVPQHEEVSQLKVMKSGQGYYIGREMYDKPTDSWEPYSRESGYSAKPLQAQNQLLRMQTGISFDQKLHQTVQKRYGTIENLQELQSGKGYVAVTLDQKNNQYNVVKMDRGEEGKYSMKAKKGYQEKDQALEKSNDLHKDEQMKDLGKVITRGAAQATIGASLER